MSSGVVFSSRVFDANKGGNSRYALALKQGLIEGGWKVQIRNVSTNKYLSAVQEVCLGIIPQNGILHYLCDTGHIFRSANRTVTTVHGIASLHNFGIRSNSQEYVWRKRVELALKNSDVVITPSESSKTDLRKVFDVNPDKIRVIKHGIDHSKFHSLITDQDWKLLSLLKKLPHKYILYIGNLDPRKNVAKLLEATQSRHWPNLLLVIVGKFAWGDKMLMNLIEKNKNVVYLGQIDDEFIAPMYRNAELFVFPSLYEGFGFPVLEALACGIPVLTTTRGNLSSFRIHGQPIIEDPLDAEEIAKKVSESLESHKYDQQLLENGLKLAANYRWQESVESHIEVYSDLLS